jgi:cellulose synthase/poly-beta-1,6-N-acetylglucosamine synthase-like glycosyltransferase
MLSLLFLLASLIVAIPLAFFVLECLASLFYRNPKYADTAVNCAVLVPAHNEEQVILPTLAALHGQLDEGDRVIVVADNCSDATAAIARDAGSIVLERTNLEQRGKGYALDHGLNYLRESPPDVVIIVDADCSVAQGSLAKLKAAAVALEKPVQASYLLQAPEAASLPIKVSEFAVLVKNQVRTKGMSVLGSPIPLLGSGMAFRWQDIADAILASGEIVEDMKLGIELACNDLGTVYLDEAKVTSQLPSTKEALAQQRERWEQGHLDMIKRFSPPLLKTALAKRKLNLLLFCLDLMIPPLSLLLAFTVAVFMVFLLLGLVLPVTAAVAVISSLFLAVLACVFLAWLFLARNILKLSELAMIPIYMASKLGIYKGFISNKQTTWKRTDRE